MLNKFNILAKLYDACYNSGVSFYQDNFGAELAYLTKAILTDMRCELLPTSQLVKVLRNKLEPNDIMWKYIIEERTVICINCEAEILWDAASYCPVLSGWLGHNCCIDSTANDYYAELVVE